MASRDGAETGGRFERSFDKKKKIHGKSYSFYTEKYFSDVGIRSKYHYYYFYMGGVKWGGVK